VDQAGVENLLTGLLNRRTDDEVVIKRVDNRPGDLHPDFALEQIAARSGIGGGIN